MDELDRDFAVERVKSPELLSIWYRHLLHTSNRLALLRSGLWSWLNEILLLCGQPSPVVSDFGPLQTEINRRLSMIEERHRYLNLRRFHCNICLEDMPAHCAHPVRNAVENESYYTMQGSCTHLYCKPCLEQYVEVHILDRKHKIPCPSPDCGEVMHEADIYRLCSPEMLERRRSYLTETYTGRSIDALVLDMPLERPCGGCERLIQFSGDRRVHSQECPGCQTSHVLDANTTQVTCSCGIVVTRVYKAECGECGAENEFDPIITAMIKPCPNCSVPVCKDVGCAEMQCTCGTAFSWGSLRVLSNGTRNAREVSEQVVRVEPHPPLPRLEQPESVVYDEIDWTSSVPDRALELAESIHQAMVGQAFLSDEFFSMVKQVSRAMRRYNYSVTLPRGNAEHLIIDFTDYGDKDATIRAIEPAIDTVMHVVGMPDDVESRRDWIKSAFESDARPNAIWAINEMQRHLLSGASDGVADTSYWFVSALRDDAVNRALVQALHTLMERATSLVVIPLRPITDPELLFFQNAGMFFA